MIPSKRLEQFDYSTGDGCNDEEENHHADWTVLIGIIDGGGKKAVSCNGLAKSIRFFVGWRVSAWNTLNLSNFSAHGHC